MPPLDARLRRYAPLLSGRSGVLLVTASVGWAVVQTGRNLLAPLLPRVIDDLGITPFEAGLVLSTMGIVFAVLQYPSGELSDQLSRKTLIVPGLALSAIGFGLIAVSPTYATLLLGAAIVGAGRAGFSIPSRALLSDRFADRRGQALGVFTMGSDAGGALASGVAIVALAIATWREPFPAVGAALLVVLLGVHRWDPEPYVVRRARLEVRGTVARLTGQPRFRQVLLAYILFRFAVSGVLGFLPTFLNADKGFSPELATTGFAFLFLVGLPTKPVAGWLSDRGSRTAIAGGALGLSTAALAVIVAAPTPLVIFPAIAGLAVGYKAIFPVMDAFFMDLSPAGTEGADLGAVRAVSAGVASLGPAYVGLVAGALSYTAAFAGLVAVLGASALIHVWLARSAA